ncbi:hypothetical protein M3Y97_01105800 [Aphelenchoides bicaudatus]|nr:hypothetical protein M3Y97_01105800 [Aphelenchoides bicaudatus]
MEQIYQQTSILIQQAQFGLGRLEQAPNEQFAQPILQEIYQQINEINENCKKIEIFVQKESVTKRKALKHRADQLKYDSNHLNSSLNALQVRLHDRWRRAAEREELLHQRFRPNETSVNFGDQELLINDKVRSANRGVDDLIAHGTAVLDSLKLQGANLSSVKQKIFDIGQTLGISNTTLRMIERRVGEDWILFCIGCVVVLIFMYCFYRFWMG